MTCKLPPHGQIDCAICHKGQPFEFDRTATTSADGSWRIVDNPMAWGNPEPEIVVLGFSKGPTQTGALRREPHEEIAFKKGRTNLAKILHHVGLIARPDGAIVDREIANPNSRFHFGSLIRCSVQRKQGAKWAGTGGNMLDKFVATDFGWKVATSCTEKFLGQLPSSVKLVVLLGMGTKQKYVGECKHLIQQARGGHWRDLNAVTYTDGSVTFVHTEHFAAQGALLPNWLGHNDHDRSKLGLMSREGVSFALGLAA